MRSLAYKMQNPILIRLHCVTQNAHVKTIKNKIDLHI